jgi:nucleotide-binding universal stress UspA family protein
MNNQKILFPTDFSAASLIAFDTAVSLARDRDATLLIAHCEETPVVYSGEVGFAAAVPSDVELQGMLRNLKHKVHGVACETRLIHGTPWQGIVGLAEKEEVNLIVMGTHGRTGVLRMLMGSVAEAVVRHAPCPVLTIRQPERVPATTS